MASAAASAMALSDVHDDKDSMLRNPVADAPPSPTTSSVEEDSEAPEIRGVDSGDIPSQYWWSFRFLGSGLSVILLAVSLYIGFSLPVSALPGP